MALRDRLRKYCILKRVRESPGEKGEEKEDV